MIAGQTPLHYVILDNGQNASMVLKKLSKYPLDVDIRDKQTGKTVLELCQTKGRKHLMPILLEAVQTWNEFKQAVQLGLDKPEVCNICMLINLVDDLDEYVLVVLFLCVCMYVQMCSCTHAHEHVHTHTHTRAHVHTHVPTCTHSSHIVLFSHLHNISLLK